MTALLHLDPFEHMLRARGYPGTPFCEEVPAKVARAVRARDGNACRYCGFGGGPASDQPLHHLDHDHGNHAAENLVTACLHCHGVHHAAHWARRGRALVVFLPEMSQARLSALARATAVAALAPDPFDAPEAGRLLEGMRGERDEAVQALEARAKAVEDALGSCDPEVLHQALSRVPGEVGMGARVAGLRIWLRLDVAPGEDDPHGVRKADVWGWTMPGGPYAFLGG